MSLKPTTCTYCLKSVVLPCESGNSADRCSQYRTAGQIGEAAVAKAVDLPLNPAPTPGPLEPVQEPPVVTPADPFTIDTAEALLRKAMQPAPVSPMKVQIGGDHYSTMPIQPLTYIQVNELDFEEGNIVKYVSRWRKKNGIEDLKKARDMLDKKIAFEEAKAKAGLMEYLRGLFKSV